MYIDSAMEVWVSIEGTQYKFADCTRILQQLPKYDPMVDSSDEEQEEGKEDGSDDGDKKPKAKTYNKLGHVMGENQERPMGNKKAKRQKILEKLEAGSIQSSQAADTVAVSSQRMAAAVERRQRHDSWYKRADMFFRMGDHQKAQEMLDRMEEDEIEAKKEKEKEIEQEKKTEAVVEESTTVPAAISVPQTSKDEDEEDGNEEDDDDDDDDDDDGSSDDDSRLIKKTKKTAV